MGWISGSCITKKDVLFNSKYCMAGGWDSTIGTVTCYGLDGPSTKSRWGHRPGRTTHPASCTMRYQIFPGRKVARFWCWPHYTLLKPSSKSDSFVSILHLQRHVMGLPLPLLHGNNSPEKFWDTTNKSPCSGTWFCHLGIILIDSLFPATHTK